MILWTYNQRYSGQKSWYDSTSNHHDIPQNLPRDIEAEGSEPLKMSQRLGAHCLFWRGTSRTTLHNRPGKIGFQKNTVSMQTKTASVIWTGIWSIDRQWALNYSSSELTLSACLSLRNNEWSFATVTYDDRLPYMFNKTYYLKDNSIIVIIIICICNRMRSQSLFKKEHCDCGGGSRGTCCMHIEIRSAPPV